MKISTVCQLLVMSVLAACVPEVGTNETMDEASEGAELKARTLDLNLFWAHYNEMFSGRTTVPVVALSFYDSKPGNPVSYCVVVTHYSPNLRFYVACMDEVVTAWWPPPAGTFPDRYAYFTTVHTPVTNLFHPWCEAYGPALVAHLERHFGGGQAQAIPALIAWIGSMVVSAVFEELVVNPNLGNPLPLPPPPARTAQPVNPADTVGIKEMDMTRLDFDCFWVLDGTITYIMRPPHVPTLRTERMTFGPFRKPCGSPITNEMALDALEGRIQPERAATVTNDRVDTIRAQ